jgi:hypothetical protein
LLRVLVGQFARNALVSLPRNSGVSLRRNGVVSFIIISKDRVQYQIQDLKEIADIDEETYAIINQIIIDGHDGAHPHLPILTFERAKILLELMKDVMFQLFVRKGKMEQAAELRKKKD